MLERKQWRRREEEVPRSCAAFKTCALGPIVMGVRFFMRSLQTMGEAPRRLTTPRRTLLHAAARHDPFEQRTLVYHEDVAESLDLGDSVCHEVDAIEIGIGSPS